VRQAGGEQAAGDAQHAGAAHHTWAEPVGQHAGACAEHEIDQPGQAEHQGHVGPLRRELGGERLEERGKRIRHAKDDRQAEEGCPDHDPGIGRFIVHVQVSIGCGAGSGLMEAALIGFCVSISPRRWRRWSWRN
jgi:hypothetical protein